VIALRHSHDKRITAPDTPLPAARPGERCEQLEAVCWKVHQCFTRRECAIGMHEPGRAIMAGVKRWLAGFSTCAPTPPTSLGSSSSALHVCPSAPRGSKKAATCTSQEATCCTSRASPTRKSTFQALAIILAVTLATREAAASCTGAGTDCNAVGTLQPDGIHGRHAQIRVRNNVQLSCAASPRVTSAPARAIHGDALHPPSVVILLPILTHIGVLPP
jgi:hypothetical protein